MELHTPADCLITLVEYMRTLGDSLGNILQVRDKDLVKWRRNHELKAQPAVIIASTSPNFQWRIVSMNMS